MVSVAPDRVRPRTTVRRRPSLGLIGIGRLVIAVLAIGASRPVAHAHDLAHPIGAGGWSLEFFGDDVALIRSRNAGAGHSPESAALTLSCDGASRRWRLTLPGAAPLPRSAASGSILVRPIDRGGRLGSGLTTRVASDGRTTLTGARDAGPRPGDPVLPLARMLKARPAALDLLVHIGPGPVSLSGLTALRLSLTIGETDGNAFGAFADRCARAGPPDRQ